MDRPWFPIRRRYLSEDIELLERLSIVVCEQVERMRNSEMQALVSQAELRAPCE